MDMTRVSERSTQLPSGLRIESTVICSPPRLVKAEGSVHEVRGVNRSLLSYIVSIKATCEPSEICYVTPSENLSSWSDTMRVPSRPGRGGPGTGVRSCGLSSLGTSESAIVRLDLVAQLDGYPYSASDTIIVQVDSE